MQDSITVICRDLEKAPGPISTGIGFLDHMIDQFNSHAQIGVSVLVKDMIEGNAADKHNRHACLDQSKLFQEIGKQLGNEFKNLLQQSATSGATSRFCCPLDEALVACELTRQQDSSVGHLQLYTLAPYGKFPKTGRKFIGFMQTEPLELFWSSVAQAAGLVLVLEKIRGDNAHHIVESSFKAFSRAFRNLLDGANCSGDDAATSVYGEDTLNWRESIALGRQGSVTRKTKETSISTVFYLDGGAAGSKVHTGVSTLDDFLMTLAREAAMSLQVECSGDLWIDEHHTAEDVAIAIGQVLNDAFGTKAGLNRMWCSKAVVGETQVEVTMDLSNRPCLKHNLTLDSAGEKVGELSLEMFEHVLDSLVVNSRMTVHVVEHYTTGNLSDTVQAVAIAFGGALRLCAMVDSRRAGATASSKGTLSV